MKLVRSALSFWLGFGGQLLSLVGLAIILIIVGAAIYAKWIHPEAEVNDVVNNQLLGQVPAWGWYVVLAVGLPMILLLVAGSLMTAPIMAVGTLLVWLAYSTVSVCRRLFTSRDRARNFWRNQGPFTALRGQNENSRFHRGIAGFDLLNWRL